MSPYCMNWDAQPQGITNYLLRKSNSEQPPLICWLYIVLTIRDTWRNALAANIAAKIHVIITFQSCEFKACAHQCLLSHVTTWLSYKVNHASKAKRVTWPFGLTACNSMCCGMDCQQLDNMLANFALCSNCGNKWCKHVEVNYACWIPFRM